VNISVRKGAAKTEYASEITFAELHPFSPVRFDGFDRYGRLKQGRPVVDPFIPMLANAKIQSERLAYGALKTICELCQADVRCRCKVCQGDQCHWCGERCLGPDLFDIGAERIIRLGPDGRKDGECCPVSSAPDTNDGGRTTCNIYDETHRLYLPSEKEAVHTMDENLGKRVAQDPWGMAVTTAGAPGQNSVAEDDHFEAEQIANGDRKVARLSVFYFHRSRSPHWDMSKFEDRCKAIIEASGPELAARTDVENLASRWDKPKIDKGYLDRVWTNSWEQHEAHAFNLVLWKACQRPGARIRPGAWVSVGFDGSRKRDTTGFVVTDMRSGLQQVEGYWRRPPNADPDWEVPELEVNEKRAEIFRRYRVMMLYADPAYWNYTVGDWAAHDPDHVQEWWTNQPRRICKTMKLYADAMESKSVGHDSVDGDLDAYEQGALTTHIGNTGRHFTTLVDDPDGPDGPTFVWIPCKLHPTRKIDLAMAGGLSWQARLDHFDKLPKPKGSIQVLRRGGFGKPS
jgi:hypothetical protein